MRILILALLSLLGLILQTTIFAHLRFFGVIPDLVLILTVCFSLLRGAKEGAIVGFFSGLLEDMFTGQALGINAASKMVIAYLIGLTEEKVYKENPWVAVAALLIATILNNLLVVILYKIFFTLPNLDFTTFNQVLWPAIVYNSLLAPFVYVRLYSWLSKPKHY